MKKIFAGTLLLLMATGMFTGCSNVRNNVTNSLASVRATDPDFDENKTRYMEFVMDLAGKNAERNEEENVLISPASVLFALEMTAAGANGDTLDQMTQVLLPGATPEQAQAFTLNYLDSLDSNNFGLADSIWIDNSMEGKIKDEYIKYLREYYGAEASKLELCGSEGTINDWVADKTDDRIPELSPAGTFDDLTAAVIVNAITFDGVWETSISDDSVWEGGFTNADGNVTETDLMSFEEDIWLENDLVTGFIKPYDGGRYGFMALLPKDEDLSGNDILQDLTAEDYMKLWENREETDVNCIMPEFEASYHTLLNEDLYELGMEDAFTHKADFTGITDSNDIMIDQVIHEAMIDVNREGTEAAAATAVVIRYKSEAPSIAKKSVNCNRPFAYAIIDMETGLPVFMGSINQM